MIFFFSCNPCSNTIPFGFSGKDTFFFFLKSISRSEYEKPFERIAILFFFFKPERVKIFRCKSRNLFSLSFFLFFFSSLSWHRGTYFIEISPQFVRFVSTVIQAQGDGERMVNDICTRVHMRGQHFCALNKNDSQYLGQ